MTSFSIVEDVIKIIFQDTTCQELLQPASSIFILNIHSIRLVMGLVVESYRSESATSSTVSSYVVAWEFFILSHHL